ncbi:ribbon-helix-helix domain-containing protein [Vacuolonema iberomarrocanum]|uniref:ribbon-helix-helix domain-containing protein n=1 Tax=Vacuolonema iberomarrocanum TaxID=3454632 RepID=UPI0019F1CBFA|nr:type II toxin-antitoxin system ParD family antitoxin [filamentous cyanobacterium LEGE 07170]
MLNISLPDQVQAFVEEQAKAAGFDSPSDYVYQLIVWEQERMAQQERIESLSLDGLNSGESIEATDSWWDQKRAGLVERN